MSELKVYRFLGSDEVRADATIGNDFYLKSEVDKVLADKDAKILALDAEVFKQKHHAELFLDERNYAENQLRTQISRIKEMKDAAADIGFTWQDYDAGEDAWEDQHTGKWVKIPKEIPHENQ